MLSKVATPSTKFLVISSGIENTKLLLELVPVHTRPLLRVTCADESPSGLCTENEICALAEVLERGT